MLCTFFKTNSSLFELFLKEAENTNTKNVPMNPSKAGKAKLEGRFFGRLKTCIGSVTLMSITSWSFSIDGF